MTESDINAIAAKAKNAPCWRNVCEGPVQILDLLAEIKRLKGLVEQADVYIREAKAACRPYGVSGQPLASIIREMRERENL